MTGVANLLGIGRRSGILGPPKGICKESYLNPKVIFESYRNQKKIRRDSEEKLPDSFWWGLNFGFPSKIPIRLHLKFLLILEGIRRKSEAERDGKSIRRRSEVGPMGRTEFKRIRKEISPKGSWQESERDPKWNPGGSEGGNERNLNWEWKGFWEGIWSENLKWFYGNLKRIRREFEGDPKGIWQRS